MSCLEWNEAEGFSNLLACATYKTSELEIWDTEIGSFIKRMKFDSKIVKVAWSPTRHQFVMVMTADREAFIINYENGNSFQIMVG